MNTLTKACQSAALEIEALIPIRLHESAMGLPNGKKDAGDEIRDIIEKHLQPLVVENARLRERMKEAHNILDQARGCLDFGSYPNTCAAIDIFLTTQEK